MNYEMMIPPFEIIRFKDMNKVQAKEYFEWYMSQKENRINVLKNYIKDDGGDIVFDYTVDSLIPLWEWYESKISYRELSDKEVESRKKRYPQWMENYISNKDLSFETLKISLDVAIYFAEVIVRNNDEISWGYFTKPKNRISVNEPTLLGFICDKDLNPRTIVNTCTRRSGREKNKNRLYDIYHVWMDYIEKS